MFKSYIILITTVTITCLYQTPQADAFCLKHNINIDLNQKWPYGKKAQDYVEALKIRGFSVNSNKEDIKKTPLINESNLTPTPISIVETQNTVTPTESKLEQVKNNKIADTEVKNEIEDTTTLKEVAVQNEECISKCTVLMLGDSVMGDVAMSLKRKIKKLNPDWVIIDAHKVSTGLTNSSYYNWPEIANELIEAKKPAYVYILMGMNDAQPMMIGNKGYLFGKETWLGEYKNRVNAIIKGLEDANINTWKWIELPSVANSEFNNKLDVIRTIQKAEVPEEKFIEVDSLVGSYVTTPNKNEIKTRAGDGIHLNVKGSDIVADKIVKLLIK